MTKDDLYEVQFMISLLPSFGMVEERNYYQMDIDHLALKRLTECLSVLPGRKILLQRMEKDSFI